MHTGRIPTGNLSAWPASLPEQQILLFLWSVVNREPYRTIADFSCEWNTKFSIIPEIRCTQIRCTQFSKTFCRFHSVSDRKSRNFWSNGKRPSIRKIIRYEVSVLENEISHVFWSFSYLSLKRSTVTKFGLPKPQVITPILNKGMVWSQESHTSIENDHLDNWSLERTVFGDCSFDNLCGSLLQSQVISFRQLKIGKTFKNLENDIFSILKFLDLEQNHRRYARNIFRSCIPQIWSPPFESKSYEKTEEVTSYPVVSNPPNPPKFRRFVAKFGWFVPKFEWFVPTLSSLICIQLLLASRRRHDFGTT